MNDLISLTVVDGEPRVDSRLIAEQLGVEHESFRKLVYQYQPDFEEFGQLRFEIGEIGFPDFKSENPPATSKGGRPEKYVLLNEDQSYLGLTYAQNTPQARELKKRLVRSFGEHRRAAAGNIPWPKPLSAMESDGKLAPYKMEFEGFPLHVYVSIGNIPWFCAPDIARILDFSSWRSMRTEVGWCDALQLEVRTASGIKLCNFIDLATVQRAIQQQRIEFRAQRFEDWLLDAAMPVLQRINTSAHELLKKAVRELLQSPDGGVIRRQIALECARLGLLGSED